MTTSSKSSVRIVTPLSVGPLACAAEPMPNSGDNSIENTSTSRLTSVLIKTQYKQRYGDDEPGTDLKRQASHRSGHRQTGSGNTH